MSHHRLDEPQMLSSRRLGSGRESPFQTFEVIKPPNFGANWRSPDSLSRSLENEPGPNEALGNIAEAQGQVNYDICLIRHSAKSANGRHLPALPGVERVAQAVAQEIECHERQ